MLVLVGKPQSDGSMPHPSYSDASNGNSEIVDRVDYLLAYSYGSRGAAADQHPGPKGRHSSTACTPSPSSVLQRDEAWHRHPCRKKWQGPSVDMLASVMSTSTTAFVSRAVALHAML